MQDSDLWALERQLWRDPDDDEYMCMDGVDLYFERRTSDAYYTASGNGSCEVPFAVRAVVYKAMKISGGPSFRF